MHVQRSKCGERSVTGGAVCIGVGSNSIFGGLNVVYIAIAAICTECININSNIQ